MSDKKTKAESRTKSNKKKLQLNKETLKDLSTKDAGRVKGGARRICSNNYRDTCC